LSGAALAPRPPPPAGDPQCVWAVSIAAAGRGTAGQRSALPAGWPALPASLIPAHLWQHTRLAAHPVPPLRAVLREPTCLANCQAPTCLANSEAREVCPPSCRQGGTVTPAPAPPFVCLALQCLGARRSTRTWWSRATSHQQQGCDGPCAGPQAGPWVGWPQGTLLPPARNHQGRRRAASQQRPILFLCLPCFASCGVASWLPPPSRSNVCVWGR
jgi:hypothetical protein